MKPISFKQLKECFIIAEISANHGQNFQRAIQLIKLAKECGADAVKFQCYTPDTLTIDVDNKYFQIKHPQWGGQTLYRLYQHAYTPWEWFPRLKKAAHEARIHFFSTAFDRTSVDFLEKIGVDLHKIASFELNDLPLIDYVARTKKPLILSTGMASLEEIREAVAVARKSGAKDLALLRCVSNYPADPKDMNLRTMVDMHKRFKCCVGLSDHTLGVGVAVASVALGAMVIEKHFTLSRKIKTPDSFFSLEPEELKEMVDNVRLAQRALGHVSYACTPAEKASLKFRRSLFVVQDIKKGDVFSLLNIRSIRPGHGLSPKHWDTTIGKKAKCAVKRGTPLTMSMIGI
ncbi:MAG: pseudaminic acid synthase [Candidatus Omnitrophica bacterium]|nr:pseudaminic acid synthase [Candidatus Omnitrophota bacterium]